MNRVTKASAKQLLPVLRRTGMGSVVVLGGRPGGEGELGGGRGGGLLLMICIPDAPDCPYHYQSEWHLSPDQHKPPSP